MRDDTQTLTTTDLVLEPLRLAHADDMFAVLSDPALYRYLDDGPPPSVEHLRDVYARLETGRSPDGSQRWLNWIVRPPGEAPIGYVQATVTEQRVAWVGFVFASRHGGRGLATQAVHAMLAHVVSVYGVVRFMASVESENERSVRLLQRLGFRDATEQELTGHSLSETERLFVR